MTNVKETNRYPLILRSMYPAPVYLYQVQHFSTSLFLLAWPLNVQFYYLLHTKKNSVIVKMYLYMQWMCSSLDTSHNYMNNVDFYNDFYNVDFYSEIQDLIQPCINILCGIMLYLKIIWHFSYFLLTKFHNTKSVLKFYV